MTAEQEKQVARIGRELKEVFVDFYGFVRFNLSGNMNDVKIEVSQQVKAKSK